MGPKPEVLTTTEKVEVIQSKRKQVYGFGAFTVLVLVVLLVGAIRPSISTILRLNQEIKQKKIVLQQLIDKVNTINALKIQYDQFQSTAEDLRLVYPSTGDFSLFMANIEQLSKKYDYNLTSISFNDSDNPEDAGTSVLIPMNSVITIRGTDENLIPFIKAIEGMPMYPVVDKVSYNNQPTPEGDINFTISIVIYKIDDPLFYE